MGVSKKTQRITIKLTILKSALIKLVCLNDTDSPQGVVFIDN